MPNWGTPLKPWSLCLCWQTATLPDTFRRPHRSNGIRRVGTSSKLMSKATATSYTYRSLEMAVDGSRETPTFAGCVIRS